MTDRPIDKDFGPEPEVPEEPSAEAATEPFGPPPVKGLTIPPNRLAGSVNCLNCGTEMQGPFCHYCGQPDKHFMRFFPVLVRDLITDLLDLDSRFFRTMKTLLLQPGKLTRDLSTASDSDTRRRCDCTYSPASHFSSWLHCWPAAQ